MTMRRNGFSLLEPGVDGLNADAAVTDAVTDAAAAGSER